MDPFNKEKAPLSPNIVFRCGSMAPLVSALLRPAAVIMGGSQSMVSFILAISGDMSNLHEQFLDIMSEGEPELGLAELATGGAEINKSFLYIQVVRFPVIHVLKQGAVISYS